MHPLRLMFDTGRAIDHAARMHWREAEREHKVVYLLWGPQDCLLGVCGTRDRTEMEAVDLTPSVGEIRIEARQVHS